MARKTTNGQSAAMVQGENGLVNPASPPRVIESSGPNGSKTIQLVPTTEAAAEILLDTAAERTWKPKGSIYSSPAMRVIASNAGPKDFHELVEQARKFKATGDYKQTVFLWWAEREGATGVDQFGRIAGGPFNFLTRLAFRVAKGELFEGQLNFGQVLQKGGTLAEWAHQARVGFDISGLTELAITEPPKPRFRLTKKA